MPVSGKKKNFLDIFPVPDFLLLSTAGVVMDEEGARFVELKRSFLGGGFKLSHLNHEPGADPSATLKKFVERYGNKFISAALPEEKSYLFTATIDRVPPEGVRDAVAFILEENVPISLAEAIFDFEIINKNSQAPKIKLAVAVVPKSVVERETEILNAAGLTPASFDIESRAIARAVIPRQDKRTHIVVNLSHKKTGFYVVEDGVVQFSTTVAHGVGSDSSSASLSDIRAEMRKVMTFWDARVEELREAGEEWNQARKIERALLCGAGAARTDLANELMQESGVEHALADIWVNASAKAHAPKMIFEEHLDYAPAIGLVLTLNK